MDYRDHHDYLRNEENQRRNEKTVHYQDDEVSIGAWLVILILTAIPFINIIAILVLAFGHDNESVKNYGKAVLILMVITLFLAILTGGCSML